MLFGAVHAGQVEHKVGFPAVAVELFGGGVEVIFKDFLDDHVVVPGLAVLDVIELGAQVLPYESLGAGDEDLHLLSSCWMYSRLAILALVSSRFNCLVLLELNSSIVTALTLPSVKNLS